MKKITAFRSISYLVISLIGLFLLSPQIYAQTEAATGSATFIYGDREADVEGLKRGWGFAVLLEFDGKTVLFNTAGSEEVLKNNMNILGIDPKDLDAIVISHEHWEMHEGMEFILKANKDVVVYAPKDLVDVLLTKSPAYQKANYKTIREFEQLTPNIILQKLKSGPSHGGPKGIDEIHLILKTEKGLVVFIGCGHPGLMRQVEASKALTGVNRIHLLGGGFHLPRDGFHIHIHDSGEEHDVPQGGNAITTDADYQQLMVDLKAAGVENVMPTHCTLEPAEGFFKKAFREKYIYHALGMNLKIPVEPTVHQDDYKTGRRTTSGSYGTQDGKAKKTELKEGDDFADSQAAMLQGIGDKLKNAKDHPNKTAFLGKMKLCVEKARTIADLKACKKR